MPRGRRQRNQSDLQRVRLGNTGPHVSLIVEESILLSQGLTNGQSPPQNQPILARHQRVVQPRTSNGRVLLCDISNEGNIGTGTPNGCLTLAFIEPNFFVKPANILKFFEETIQGQIIADITKDEEKKFFFFL